MSETPEYSAYQVWSDEASIERNRLNPRLIFDTDQKFQALANEDSSDMLRQVQLDAIEESFSGPLFIERRPSAPSLEASPVQRHRPINLEVAGIAAKATVKAIGRQLGRATTHLLMKREDTL
jgi:hypothetical protein